MPASRVASFLLKEASPFSLIEKELCSYEEEDPIAQRVRQNLKALFKPDLPSKEGIFQLLEDDLNQLDPVPMDALQQLDKLRTEKGSYTITDIDDLMSLFEIPSVISKTCQSIEAEGEYNIGLIDAVMGGGTRLLAIQDSSGDFAARAILRIFNDETPFLLLEPIYDNGSISNIKAYEVIKNIALAKAKDLNVKLFRSNNIRNIQDGVKKPVRLWLRPGTFIYSDSLRFGKIISGSAEPLELTLENAEEITNSEE